MLMLSLKAKLQSQVMAEYSTPVYPHGTGPPAITDQITDQNTPYCDELRYPVSKKPEIGF